MTSFDACTLWSELQKKEALFRSGIKPKNDVKKNKFWRKQKSTKEKRSRNKWIGKNIVINTKTKYETKSNITIYSIKHAINCLNDTESATPNRINCLHFINQYLKDYNNDLKGDDILESVEILKTVIKIFVDPKEPLRSLSIDIIQNHIGTKNKIWNYEISIKYIIPIIVHCILSEEYNEKSEEIRLKFIYLLQNIIQNSSNENEIKPICGDLLAILIKLLHDEHNEINKKTCSVIILLSAKIRLNNVSKMIIENTLELLSHRHSNVRISAIQLIECMLMNGGHECIQTLTGFREHNVVPLQWWFGGEIRANYFGALCRHSKYAVRKTFYKMIFKIMTNMLERYDYKTLLLSYLLSGLQDENKQIQEMTFDAIENIGKMHEEDEYSDLKKTLFYQNQAEAIVKNFFGEDPDKLVLPFPFKHRPCLGSRVLIREHFNRIIHAALSEFKDWKTECREMSISLVRNMIVYSEEYCTQNTELLLSAFHDCVDDKNSVLCVTSQQCCSLVGKYVYPVVWIDYLGDMLYHEFDIEWIIVLQQLLLYVSLKKLYQVTKQLVAIMEYVLPFMKASHKPNIIDVVVTILNITDKAIKQYDDDPFQGTEDVDDFQFSSEYCGFHLEIIDESHETEQSTKMNNVETLQERIGAMLNECQSIKS